MPTGFNPADYTPGQLEAIEHVLACLDGDIFRNTETGEVVILTDGGNYIVSVDKEGGISSTYAYAQPPAIDPLGAVPVDKLIAEEGWDASWEC